MMFDRFSNILRCQLPSDCDAQHVGAKYEHGILHINLARIPQEQMAAKQKYIDIQ